MQAVHEASKVHILQKSQSAQKFTINQARNYTHLDIFTNTSLSNRYASPQAWLRTRNTLSPWKELILKSGNFFVLLSWQEAITCLLSRFSWEGWGRGLGRRPAATSRLTLPSGLSSRAGTYSGGLETYSLFWGPEEKNALIIFPITSSNFILSLFTLLMLGREVALTQHADRSGLLLKQQIKGRRNEHHLCKRENAERHSLS